jgi:Family of unknown function (DUF6200)
MATPATSAPEQKESREHASKSQIVVVDLGEMQSSLAVKRLRKGKGKLFNNVEQIVKDLIEDGTVKSNAQPVVIVVREYPSPWVLSDDDDDD